MRALLSSVPAASRRRLVPLLGAAALAVASLTVTTLGTTGRAEAGVALPALAAAPAPAGVATTAEPVRWVCGTFRCVWRPNYPSYWYVPHYARGWGPPPRPECYWRRGWNGWATVCP